MADAEIIPIGTRGRPGRGSGSMHPSSAARGLAASRTPPGPEAGPQSEAEPEPDAVAASPADEAPGEPPEPVATEQRGAIPGIPVEEWWAAIRAAALELWGHDWEGALAALLASWRRRLEGDYTVDDYGFDAEFTEQFVLAVLRPIAHKWFRIEVRGADNIPDDGGALIVSNHSGTLPVDAMMTGVVVHDETGRFLRPLGADLVFRLPMVSAMARKTGATLACNEDAERMLRSGELVGVWPEGFKGIGKPFSERYRLQRFGRGGFVSAAMRTGVPIVPLSVVGAEEIYPMVGNLSVLARVLGVPYIPVTPTFPLLGPLGLVPLPSKWLMEFGEPIRTDELDEGAADDPMLVFDVTDQVRETIQQTLFALLRERGSVFG
ncbi:1-acyl-sn-glycerol-3-phosphate acyltransferase [Nocardioides sp.]|uniref:1-acyl-sn-glycerol-3-phosphate acyltransferase n=1 Tax=Nocardioides sp. TaxID=35761 RepID=UPI003526D8EC